MKKPAGRGLLLWLLARIPIKTSPASAPPRILLVRPDHLGDLLFMTPALHALRASQPDAQIACLVGPWGQPVLHDNPDLDELLTCDFPWFNRRPKASPWQPYAVLRREAARLRCHRFDVAYIMRFDFWWGAALARLAGIPRRIGYALSDVQPFLTDPVPYTPGLHEVEQNLRLVSAPLPPAGPPPLSHRTAMSKGRGEGGGSEGQPRLRFTIPPANAAWAAARLAAPDAGSPTPRTRHPKPDAPPLFAVHAGAGAAVKLWQIDDWARVINELGRRHKATAVLTGSVAEKPLVQAITARLTIPYMDLSGETNLGQLAAVFARSRLVLGADSGPLHLAVAVGTPTVHLFGPVDPTLFGPWGDHTRHAVVRARYADEPCHNRPCNRLDYTAAELPQHTCMQTITVDDVLTAASSVWWAGQPHGKQ